MSNPLYKCCMDLWDEHLVGKKMAFDIGANDGGFARMMAQKGLKVHAYEPVPDQYQNLLGVVAEYPSITPHNLAVKDNTNPLIGVNVFSAWTLLSDNSDWGKAQGYVDKPPFNCRCTTIDRESWNLGLPDFIKIDVDGYEHKVLTGAVKTLEKSRCPVMFEYSFLMTKVGDDPKSMCDLIYSLGYQAWSMDGKYCATTAGDMLNCFPADTSFDVMLLHNQK